MTSAESVDTPIVVSSQSGSCSGRQEHIELGAGERIGRFVSHGETVFIVGYWGAVTQNEGKTWQPASTPRCDHATVDGSGRLWCAASGSPLHGPPECSLLAYATPPYKEWMGWRLPEEDAYFVSVIAKGEGVAVATSRGEIWDVDPSREPWPKHPGASVALVDGVVAYKRAGESELLITKESVLERKGKDVVVLAKGFEDLVDVAFGGGQCVLAERYGRIFRGDCRSVWEPWLELSNLRDVGIDPVFSPIAWFGDRWFVRGVAAVRSEDEVYTYRSFVYELNDKSVARRIDPPEGASAVLIENGLFARDGTRVWRRDFDKDRWVFIGDVAALTGWSGDAPQEAEGDVDGEDE